MPVDRLTAVWVVYSLLLHGAAAVVLLRLPVAADSQPDVVCMVDLGYSLNSAEVKRTSPKRLAAPSKKSVKSAPRPTVVPVAISRTVGSAPRPVPATVAMPTAEPSAEANRAVHTEVSGVTKLPSSSGPTRMQVPQSSKGEEGGAMATPQLGDRGAPAFSRKVEPVYPPQARRLRREGVVVLKLVIDADGRLQGVEVVQRAGFGFEEAAVTAIRQSRYTPARQDGVAVASQALITIRFLQ